jgi:hypothetical protein
MAKLAIHTMEYLSTPTLSIPRTVRATDAKKKKIRHLADILHDVSVLIQEGNRQKRGNKGNNSHSGKKYLQPSKLHEYLPQAGCINLWTFTPFSGIISSNSLNMT